MAGNALDTRVGLLKNEAVMESATDDYLLMRAIYLQNRFYQINGGAMDTMMPAKLMGPPE